MLREKHPRAQQVLDMLAWNGGGRYSSGVGIANIDFNGQRARRSVLDVPHVSAT